MNTPSDAQKTVAVTPLPDLNLLAAALGHSPRWKILKELSAGEPRMVRELGQVARCSPDMASKQLAKVREAGAVGQGRRPLCQIPKQYLSARGERVVDFGHCLLRRDAAG